MPETAAVKEDRKAVRDPWLSHASGQSSFISLCELWFVVRRSWRLFVAIIGMLLFACLLYCLIAPAKYEATAQVALRGTPVSVLRLDRAEGSTPGSFASGQVQLETLANVFRSDQLAWEVITRLKLYATPDMMGRCMREFPGLNPEQPSPEAKACLLDAFQRNLNVQSIPRTLVLQIRFRAHDASLSAKVVNSLIDAYHQHDLDARVEATRNATAWLGAELRDLKEQIDRNDRELADFQKEHGILDTPETFGNGQPSQVVHSAELNEVDALSRELATATTDRIVREAEYRAASEGDPEAVLASDAKLQATGAFASVLLQQLRGRRMDLEQEQAQLRIEHGPNFPRVVEIRNQMQDLDAQILGEDGRLVKRFRSAWMTAADREQMVRKSLADATTVGMNLNESALRYAVMRQEANAKHDTYIRVQQQAEEAGLVAGSEGSDLTVIDYARQPIKPVSPDLPIYMAITLFVSVWLALAAVLVKESIYLKAPAAAILIAFAFLTAGLGSAQAPTPSTSGLPTGVARIPQSTETKSQPNAKDAPAVWNLQGGSKTGLPPGATATSTMPMASLIGPGDMLQISEAHTPDTRPLVRVSAAGSVTLPLAGDVNVSGMDEVTAAHAIESALVDRGMLLHPQVTVLVTAYAGQDISVLGEVARPGVYALTVHHRLLDLLSSASGLSQNAGSLVTITHRDDRKSMQAVVLDPAGLDTTSNHNPELLPGDTVQVSRAGLVYVVGDVVRPGGFPVDPMQTTTVVQALSLAWGPGQNAAITRAILIREQQGSRTVTTLNLKRMLRGLDPDIPIHDRDIVFVPDSMARNLWNRTMESVIQSAAGVSIYAGMVYSQRF